MVLTACGGSSSPAPAPTATPIATLPPPGSVAAATPTPRGESTPVAALTKMRVERVFPALSFAQMTGLYEPPDGTSRLFVLEQRGRVLVFENRPGVSQSSVFLDLTDRVNSTGAEEGLLGLAFAPDFGRSGNFYVYYSASNPRRSVISRFKAAPGSNTADGASEAKILEIAQPFANHNGGQLQFGPDGYLYIGLGDGGSAGDPNGNGQSLKTLLAKILRIDVNAASPGAGYRIPPDNPFVGQASTGVKEEIWAYGLRNPWRFSFDSVTGELWAGDVGQNAYEEIDIVAKGGNYGWNKMEGLHCYPPSVQGCDKSAFVAPLLEYDHSRGECSITGGFVYRGELLPSLRGAYVYADYCTGRIWALRYSGGKVAEQLEVAKADILISSFGEDRAGNLYVLAHGDRGGIFRIAP